MDEEDVAAYEALAYRNAGARVARRAALHRPASWRCGALRTPARPQWCRASKLRRPDRVTLPILPVLAETLAAGPCGDLTFIWESAAIPSPRRRSAICSERRVKPPAGTAICAWPPQGCCNTRRGSRCHRGAARSDIRMDRRPHGSLYTRAANRSAYRSRRCTMLANDERTFYSLT